MHQRSRLRNYLIISKAGLICALLGGLLHGIAAAQQPVAALDGFFTQRLTSTDPPPSFEALLRVTDTIAGSSAKDIDSAMPLLFTALKSDKENLAVEAVFTLFAISQRPDGGSLLRARVAEIGSLLDLKDERVSGGASSILRQLTPSSPDLTVSLMTKYLKGPATPNLIKVNVASTLLSFRPSDPQVITAIGIFLGRESEPKVRIAMLQAIGANHISNPDIDDFAIRSLDDKNKYVKVAAIDTIHSLGPEARSRAQPAITELATNLSEDQSVRIAAENELKR